MYSSKKELVLKYGIPGIAVIIIVIQFFLVDIKKLNRWKGGGYGMYTEIHYYYNQIHIPGMSVDSLLKNDLEMKNTLGYLMLMPNKNNLNKAGRVILKKNHEDSIHIQIWKPIVDSKTGYYTRELIDELHLKNTDF